VHPQPEFGREAADELRRVGAEPEACEDLVSHDGRGGGGTGHHACVGQIGHQVAELEVVRPEVVSPLGNTVRFVDRDQRTVDVAHQRAEPGKGESLGGNVGDLEFSARQRRDALAQFVAVERGEEGRPHAARRERATWSCISDTSGDTTSVVPLRTVAGSW
jgi:hypothetical protein